MVKVFEITPKAIKDPKVSESEVELMKLGAINYLQELGFTQAAISTIVNKKRPTVQNAGERAAKTSISIKRASPGRLSNLDEHTARPFVIIIRRDPFKIIADLQHQLRSLNRERSESTVKRWLKEFCFLGVV